MPKIPRRLDTFCVCDDFGPLSNELLKCQIYLKGVTYMNTEESRIFNEQKELLNMKYLYK